MCFGGGSKQPSQDIPPVPAPTPMPAAADTNPAATADQKRARVAALRFGALATIKTSGQGITGKGPDLNMPAASGVKQNLGS